MNNYLIIFDIDETLYMNHEKRIPESTLAAIDQLKKAGHTLGIATGRAPFELFHEIKSLPFDFFVMANGQLVVQNDMTIYENPLATQTIRDIVTFAEASNIQLGFSSASRSTVTGMNQAMEEAFTRYYDTYPEIDGTIFNSEPVFQMWFFSHEHETFAKKFKDQARIIPWLDAGADIVPLNSSKATGVKALIEANPGVLPEKIIFFGDGANDLELMEMADIGIAMGNAVDSLKEKADFVTQKIEDDGIYYACQQLDLFKKKERDVLEMEQAMAKLEAKIAANPKELSHYFNLSALYRAHKMKVTKILKLLEDALLHFPDDLKLLTEIAAIYEFELEEDAQAKHYYEQVLAINPEHMLARNALKVLNDQHIHSN